jgi:hypothetical protein
MSYSKQHPFPRNRDASTVKKTKPPFCVLEKGRCLKKIAIFALIKNIK